ncbi:DUF3267 domain-containing protein [Planococcus sp. N028]|uniref:DUF3267 domain-containing protein n=1 Tax=Planococcus shixiaomingii TaxID=3058393 RepID=A0ABT8N6F3_9BACL|nr:MULTISPECIES: DUF3267 domain-containing protein [unclassified Planococcus (in: firmicutes)]MDN7243459.1 DUF3267 domain-containing protein [Planococcus sp. N028]WKA55904.1 DUF3267 domain-containing protein [Planococcus sp. N022]
MHCWKTINVKKQYGFDRLFMMSALIGIGVFISFYTTLNIIYSDPLSDNYFLPFILAILGVYPLHKLCHFLPLFGCRRCIRFILKKQMVLMPIITLKIAEPVAKKHFILTLVTPFLLINSAIIILSVLMPAFSHYFAMLLAYHCSLCVPDLVYMRNLARSPKHALIEETDTGFEILVPQPMA